MNIAGASQTLQLAQFVCGLQFDQIPKEVLQRAKWLLLDQLGVQLASSRLPWSQSLLRYALAVERRLPGPCTVVGHEHLVAPDVAALLNGAFGHGFEYDDVGNGANVHPGCLIVPTVLALGEYARIGGRELLAAMVAGYEAALRIGWSMAPSSMEIGFHPTSVAGGPGTAAVAARLLGLDPAAALHAIGIACSYAGGIMEYANTGGSIKRLHAGKAAQQGINAVWLAKAGITGPLAPIEGERGLCRTFSRSPNPGALNRGLGHEYLLLNVGVKRYACCVAIHPAIEALRRLLRELQPFGPEEVDNLKVETYPTAVRVCRGGTAPQDITEMQFSIPFSMALCLMYGDNGFSAYSEENRQSPALQALAGRVTVASTELDGAGSDRAYARVQVRLREGSVLAAEHSAPFPSVVGEAVEAAVREKFLPLAQQKFPMERAQSIMDVVENLESVQDVRELGRLLQGSHP